MSLGTDPMARPAQPRHRAVLAVAAAAILGSAIAGCSSSPSSSSGNTTSGTSTSGAGSSSANTLANAVPANGIPDLKGMSITIEDQGSPDPTRITDYNVVRLLNSWGAKANLIWAPSEQIASSALLRGSAQVLFSTIPNQLPTVQTGFDIRAFGVNNPRLDYVLMSVGNITSISQLKGKTIGVLTGGPGDISYVLPEQALQSAGLSMSDVHVAATGGQSVRIAALASGRIQASAVEHLALYQLASLHPHILYDFTAKDTSLYNDFLWAKPSWLQANPKLAVAVNLAELDTYKWFNNPANKTAVLNEMVNDSPGAKMSQAEQLYNLYVKYQVLAPGAAISNSLMTAQENFYYGFHTLTSMVPLSNWANSAYDQAALAAYNKASGS